MLLISTDTARDFGSPTRGSAANTGSASVMITSIRTPVARVDDSQPSQGQSLAEENAFLGHWEANVADKRIHGTTCKQVAARFAEERPHLQPLPAALFPCYQEARRQVSRDSFVEVQRAFYEAPPEYIGRQVWVRWDSRCVRIFNDRLEQVQIHLRLEPGKFSRILGVAGMSAPVLSSCRWWIGRAALLGEACGQWAQASVDRRGAAHHHFTLATTTQIHARKTAVQSGAF